MPDDGRSASISAGLPRDTSAPRVARNLVSAELAAHLPAERLDAVRLAVSELVANAVLHGEGPIEIHVQVDDERVRGEVVDGGGGFEHELRARGPEEIGGRGLLLV